jgi:imidazolonepropionase-like amidohydrolase
MMKKNGTYLVPTLYLADWMRENAVKIGLPAMYATKMKDVTAVSRQNIKKALNAGVKIAFGTDAAVYPHGLNAHEFAVYVQIGMTPLQAIQTATVNAADLLGWSKIGSLENGNFADIIAVNGDPLKDVTLLQDPVMVMKGGTVYKQK